MNQNILIRLDYFQTIFKNLFKKMSYTNEDVDVKKYYSIVSTCLTCPNTTTVDKERNVLIYILSVQMVESFMNMINQSLVEAAVLEKKHTSEIPIKEISIFVINVEQLKQNLEMRG